MTYLKRYLKIKWFVYNSRFESVLNKFRTEQHNEAYLALVREVNVLLK